MNSYFWLGISIIIATGVHGLMNRYESHENQQAIWVVDKLTGDARLCVIDGCYSSAMEYKTDAQKLPPLPEGFSLNK